MVTPQTPPLTPLPFWKNRRKGGVWEGTPQRNYFEPSVKKKINSPYKNMTIY